MCDDVGTMLGALIMVCGFPAIYALQNLALGKPTLQTDTSWDGPPDLAVDGNTEGDYFQGSCSHTETTTDAWWEVDLGKVYAIDHVTVYGRTDCDCVIYCGCAAKLRDVQLFIGVIYDAYIEKGFHSGIIPGAFTFQLTTPVYGRWVRITRLSSVNGDDDQLDLCEVQVMGSEIKNVRFDLGQGQIGTGGLLKTSKARTKGECCIQCKMTDNCVAVNYNALTELCEQLDTVATIADISENIFFYRLP